MKAFKILEVPFHVYVKLLLLCVPVIQMCDAEVAPLSAASPRLTSGSGEDDTGGAEVVITHRGPPQHCPPPSSGPPTCYHKLTHPLSYTPPLCTMAQRAILAFKSPGSVTKIQGCYKSCVKVERLM